MQVRVRVSGVDKTTDEFKKIRRNVNGVMRDAQQKVGERVVLPPLRAELHAVAGAWADTVQVKRDRLDVFIGSRLRGTENRALGWLDFGGKRKQDSRRRIGPHIISRTLESKQDEIRDQISDAVLDQFRAAGFDVR